METFVKVINEEPRTSYIVIVENSDKNQKNTQDLITKNLSDFQEFGEVQIIEKRV